MSAAQAVIYRPNEHADEYMVFLEDVQEYEAWKTDKSIALARFLGQFSIYKSATSGHTGSLGEISKQEIASAFFGDEKNVKDKSVEAAIEIILTNGHLHKGDLSHKFNFTKNPAQGGGDVRTTGAARGSHR